MRRNLCWLLLGALTLAVALPGASGATSAGTSLRFRGTGGTGSGVGVDRVRIKLDAPGRPVDVGGSFTIEWWMKAFPGTNTDADACNGNGDAWINGVIVIDRDVFGDGDAGDYGIAIMDGGVIAFGAARGSDGSTVCGSSDVVDGDWHHIAVTRNRDTGDLRLFVDGLHESTAEGAVDGVGYRDGRSTSFPQTDPYLVLGGEKHNLAGYPSFDGWLDELRISQGVRYSGSSLVVPSGPFAPDAKTRALYHFDEGMGKTVADSSGAAGGPSNGTRAVGGDPKGPAWSTDTPFD